MTEKIAGTVDGIGPGLARDDSRFIRLLRRGSRIYQRGWSVLRSANYKASGIMGVEQGNVGAGVDATARNWDRAHVSGALGSIEIVVVGLLRDGDGRGVRWEDLAVVPHIAPVV